MQVDVSMSDDNKFHASSWWANSPDFVIKTVKAQLKAAAVIWPELEAYTITEVSPATKISTEPNSR